MRIKRFSIGLAIFSSVLIIGLASDDKLIASKAANFLGVPGVDFPVFDSVPATGFKCDMPGYFGDAEARCQVFHICQADGRHNSFLCPNGTLFNQKYLVCDWWFNVDCPKETPKIASSATEPYAVIPSAARGQARDAKRVKFDTEGVNRMGGALDSSDSEDSTTILPLEVSLDLIEDPGVTVVTERSAEVETTPMDTENMPATDTPSAYSRKGQSFIALTHEVGLVTESNAGPTTTTTQVSPIDSPVTAPTPTTEPYEGSVQNEITVKTPSRTLEPPARVYFQVVGNGSFNVENTSSLPHKEDSANQVDDQRHLSVSASVSTSSSFSPSESPSLKQEIKEHVKTGGIKHLKDFNSGVKFGSRIGKKTKSLL